MKPSVLQNHNNIRRLFQKLKQNTGGENSLIDILNTEYKTEYVYPYSYVALCKLGLPDSDPNHRIIRIDFTTFDNPVSQKALGSWDDRATLTYT